MDVVWKGLTALIAVIAVSIAYRQYRLARENLRLKLFEKRFEVFAGARLFLTHVVREANITMEQIFEYRASIGEAAFLFQQDLVDYLEEIYTAGVKLHTDYERMNPLPVGEARSALAQEISDNLGWLGDQLSNLKDQFGPYLKFDEVIAAKT